VARSAVDGRLPCLANSPGQEIVARQAGHIAHPCVYDLQLLVTANAVGVRHLVRVRLLAVAFLATKLHFGEHVGRVTHGPRQSADAGQSSLVALETTGAVGLTVRRGPGTSAHLAQRVLGHARPEAHAVAI
jgi:hypothetical protein